MSHAPVSSWSLIRAAALFCFVLAGLTGLLFRYTMVGGLPQGLDLINIRHAHSHLMAYGWATPILLMLIARHVAFLRRQAGVAPTRAELALRPLIVLAICLGLLAFPLFFFYGYGLVSVAGIRLPPAVVVSAAALICWYGFALCYLQATRRLARDTALILFDLALFFLVLGSLAVWGLAFRRFFPTVDPTGLTHWFLFLFEEGWCLIALVGAAFAALDPGRNPRGNAPFLIVLLVIPLASPLGMDPTELSGTTQALSLSANLLAAMALLSLLFRLLLKVRQKRLLLWVFPLGLLALKALMVMGLCLSGKTELALFQPFRILYLHLLLLGGLTLGTLVASEQRAPGMMPGLPLFQAEVAVFLLALVPLTPIWPGSWLWAGYPTVALVLTAPPVLHGAFALCRFALHGFHTLRCLATATSPVQQFSKLRIRGG